MPQYAPQRVATALLLIGLLPFALAQANCPVIPQATAANGQTNNGFSNDPGGVNVNVQVVNNSVGSFSSDQVNSVGTAIEGIAAVPGSNADSNTTGSNSISGSQVSSANSSSPLVIVEMATQSQIDNMGGNCAGKSACTNPTLDSNGFVKVSLTLVLPSAVGSPLFEQLMTHELGLDALGVNDYTGANAQNTIDNPNITSGSPTAPTPCDQSRIKKTWCQN